MPGFELDALAGRIAQVHQHDVVGHLDQAEHAGVERLARERIGFLDDVRRDLQVGARPCLAVQHLAFGVFGVAERIAGVGPNLARYDPALAAAAHALAAGIGNFEAGALRRVEHGSFGSQGN